MYTNMDYTRIAYSTCEVYRAAANTTGRSF